MGLSTIVGEIFSTSSVVMIENSGGATTRIVSGTVRSHNIICYHEAQGALRHITYSLNRLTAKAVDILRVSKVATKLATHAVIGLLVIADCEETVMTHVHRSDVVVDSFLMLFG